MKWLEVRRKYPNQWLIIEALQAHTTAENQCELDKIAVVENCANGVSAMQTYRHLHKQHPAREFYFIHTKRTKLNIYEQVLLSTWRIEPILLQ